MLPTAGDPTLLAYSVRRAAPDASATHADGNFGGYADAALDSRRTALLLLECSSALAMLPAFAGCKRLVSELTMSS